MSLEKQRAALAEIDEAIIELIARRRDIAGTIAGIKHREHLPIRDEARAEAVIQNAFDLAVEYGVDPVRVQAIFEILVLMSEEWQHECQGEGNLP